MSSCTSSSTLTRLSRSFILPVELAKHLVRIVDRRDGLIGARVAHARPRIGATGHGDAELQRAEAGARLRLALEEILHLLVDGDAARPAGGIAAAAPDIAGQQFTAGEQAAHAAHVAVAVAADLVVDAVEHERLALEWLERLEDRLELEGFALLVRPELIRQRAIRREHDDQPLAALAEAARRQAGQAGREKAARRRRRRDGGGIGGDSMDSWCGFGEV